MQAYISGPLHAVADLASARALYEFVAETLASAGWSVYVPHLHTDPERHRTLGDLDVFDRDFSQVVHADLIVAAIGAPSSGVGAELALAWPRGIRVVGFCRVDEAPSRFLLGMMARMGAPVLRYVARDDLRTQLLQTVQLLTRSPASTTAAGAGAHAGAAPDDETATWDGHAAREGRCLDVRSRCSPSAADRLIDDIVVADPAMATAPARALERDARAGGARSGDSRPADTRVDTRVVDGR